MERFFMLAKKVKIQPIACLDEVTFFRIVLFDMENNPKPWEPQLPGNYMDPISLN